jgi:N-methylhydantoinase B/oxoprolinase/acetone carboxylase alpha subunit
VQELRGKISLEVKAGDVIRVETPGGGGHGPAEQRSEV